MTRTSTARKTLGFQIHALVFVPTMIALFAINLLTGGPLWTVWPLLGWTIGLASHWAFGIGPTPRAFVDVWSGTDLGAFVTPTRLGFGGQTSSAAGNMWAIDYVHFTQGV